MGKITKSTKHLLLCFLASFFLITPSLLYSQAAQFIKVSKPLPNPRAFHGSAILGDYLYIMGGSSESKSASGEATEGVDNSVIKAKILPGNQPGDWILSEWENTTPLPIPLHYISNSTLVLNDVVYVIGGGSDPVGGEFSNVAYWSKPLPDGSLTPWQKSRPFGARMSTITSVSTPGHIYLIGGYERDAETDNVSTKVFSNQIFSDGTMTRWEDGPQLPIPLWFHCAGVAANRVYVWGGLADGAPDVKNTSNLVFSSQILGTGKLGPWRRDPTSLQVGIYSASAASAGPYLIAFSPRYARRNPSETAPISGDVWWTYSAPQGLYPWTREQTPVPNRVYHAVTPDYRRGTIWISGGRAERRGGMTPNISYFTLSPEARQMAENQWSSSQAAHSNTVATFETLSTQFSGGAQGSDKLSFLADKRISDDAIPGFQTISEARRDSGNAQNKKPLVMYFNVESAQPCVEQKELLVTGGFDRIKDSAAYAWINSREYPQLAQQMGIYRIPTWVVFDKNGNEVSRLPKVVQTAELEKIISTLQ